MPSPFRSPKFSSDALRFLIAGVVNTGFTLLVYQALLLVTTPALGYAGAWFAGMTFVALLYPSRVFAEGRKGPADRLALAVVYAAVFLAGLGSLHLLQMLGIAARAAILGVLVFTAFLNFILSRAVLRR